MLVIQGPAGIGKSALVRVLGEHAAGQGVQTLSARASELERDFGFGVVRQLLETRVIRPAGPSGLSGITSPPEAEPSAA